VWGGGGGGAFKSSASPIAGLAKYPQGYQEVDGEPLYVNCDADNIHLDDEDTMMMSLLALTKKARELGRSNSGVDDAMEELARCANPRSTGHLSHAVATFHAQRRPTTVAYMPPGMQSGELDGANPVQVLLCRWRLSGVLW